MEKTIEKISNDTAYYGGFTIVINEGFLSISDPYSSVINIQSSLTGDEAFLFAKKYIIENSDQNERFKKVITPAKIRTNHWFMGSVFKNSETETILRNIIVMQKNQNPDKWKPFSWDEYKSFCTHGVDFREKQVLDAFVNGGKPVTMSSAWLSPGWLSFDGERYAFTEKMINMLYEKWPETE